MVILPPKCFCRRRIIWVVSAISGSKYKTCLPSLKYFSINFTYTCVLPLLVTPCKRHTFLVSNALATLSDASCCAALNSKSISTFLGMDFMRSTARFSTINMFFSTNPFICASEAPAFFSNSFCTTSPSVFCRCR